MRAGASDDSKKEMIETQNAQQLSQQDISIHVGIRVAGVASAAVHARYAPQEHKEFVLSAHGPARRNIGGLFLCAVVDYASIKNWPACMICSPSIQMLNLRPTTSMCVAEYQSAPVCAP